MDDPCPLIGKSISVPQFWGHDSISHPRIIHKLDDKDIDTQASAAFALRLQSDRPWLFSL